MTTNRIRRRPALRLETLEDRWVPAVINVNSLADSLHPAPGVVTLRSAIQQANTNHQASNTINLTLPGTYKISLAGTPGETDNRAGEFAILSHGNLTIQNTSKGAVVVDGAHLARVFDINPNFNPANPTPKFTVTLQGFGIRNGVAQPGDGPAGSGGGIRDTGNASLTLTNLFISNNSASADGGGVVMENTVSTPWTLTLNNTVIADNHAGDAGGGIDADGAGTIFIRKGSINNNTAVNQGAGIWLDAVQVGVLFQTANLTVTGTQFSGNAALSAGTVGGAIGNAGNGHVTLSGATLTNNFSGGSGGGFGDENAQGTLVVKQSRFMGNVAATNGGAIAAGGPKTLITASQILDNAAMMSGGGVFANGTTLTVSNSVFIDNTTTGNGGALELQTTGTGNAASSITNTALNYNTAVNNAGGNNGGGIDAPSTFMGSVALTGDQLIGNFATSGGGIFYNGTTGSVFSLKTTSVTGNSAATGADTDSPGVAFTDLGGNVIRVKGH